MISPEQGVGIEFENNGNKCITLPRTSKFQLGVTASVYTYAGNVMFATHFYASLHISDLDCEIIGDDSGKKFSSNTQPKESMFKRIDVKRIMPTNIYNEKFGVKFLDTGKGCLTTRFDSIEETVEAIESTFIDKCGGEPWILVNDSYDPWEEAKARFIKLYSEVD